MEQKKLVIGVDYGSDSVRAVIMDSSNGQELAMSVSEYKRWKKGLYCAPGEFRYRQHPLDYVESLVEIIRDTTAQIGPDLARNIVGISFDTTASTPALVDREGTPLALKDEFKDDPDAMFVLWKDHTAMEEADEINTLAHGWHTDYTKYCGGTYSPEWGWSKVLHLLRTNPKVAAAAYSWIEHCDWITAILTGNTLPENVLHGRCAAGHKMLWNEEWGGYPPREFFDKLDVRLGDMRETFKGASITADQRAGGLCAEWAAKLGLPEGIAVGLGAIDCHIGAVGAGISDNVLVKVMGTSTCDIIVAPYEDVNGKQVKGICGQVDGSVIPGKIGFEAGQSSFGDVYAWFRRMLSWAVDPLVADGKADKQELEKRIFAGLEEEARQLPLTVNDPVATDWFNGRRTPDADYTRKGSITGLTLGTGAPAVFKALVEATAFGSRAINERFAAEGVKIGEIIAIGGISKKSPFVMQVMSDVIGVPIKVVRSSQACALGAAMFAAVIAGVYDNIADAQKAMGAGFDAEYFPDYERKAIYDKLYAKYLQLA